MLLGHYGVALAAKRWAPQTSLGTLTFAAQWCDLLWPILLLLGIEHVEVVPGLMKANPLDFVSYPISHSLLIVAAWAALIGGLYLAIRKNRKTALIIGALVVSHWLLDWIMHRPDLALWPGSAKYGLGLWNSIPATIALELAVFIGGLVSYLTGTQPRDRIGTWALASLAALLLLIFFSGFGAPPPPGQTAIAVVTLGLWLFVPWAHWADKHRTNRNK